MLSNLEASEDLDRKIELRTGGLIVRSGFVLDKNGKRLQDKQGRFLFHARVHKDGVMDDLYIPVTP